MNIPSKAIILGAGPCGLVTALRLHQTTGIKPIIYELRPEPTTLGGAIGIPANGLRLLDRLGVYQALVERGSSRSDFALYSIAGAAARGGGTLGQLDDFADRARRETGYGYMRIKRVDIVDVLLDAVKEAGIEVYFGKRMSAIKEDDDNVHVSFDDGSTATGDMLFGCDGIHSALRSMYIDPHQTPEYSGLAGMFSTIPATKLFPSLMKGLKGLTMTMTDNGIFMAAPCTADSDTIYFGFQRETPLPHAEVSRDGWEVHGREEVRKFKETLHGVLHNATGDWPDFLRELVENTEVIKFFPIYRLPLGRAWSKGKCLLLGDAAHAMQPHAGQGVSMAVEDAFLISRLLASQDRSVKRAFEVFCEIRRPRIEEIYQTAAANAGMRKKLGPWGQWVKENIIRLVFFIPGWLGIADKLMGQKYTVYDVDEEKCS
ncbi:hypothetical protein BDV18DRAFT_161812 [Aspergillus unguis]